MFILGNPQIERRRRGNDEYTTVLFSADGAIGANTANNTAISANTISTITMYASANIANTVSIGGSPIGSNTALYVGGAGSYCQVTGGNMMNFGTDDFTIDFWLYRIAASLQFFMGYNNVASGYASLFMQADTQIGVYASNTFSSHNVLNDERFGTCGVGVWNHYAMVRKDLDFYFFFNGTLEKIKTGVTASMGGDGFPLEFGRAYAGIYYYSSGFYMKNFRVSKGIARWTQSFDVPTKLYFYG